LVLSKLFFNFTLFNKREGHLESFIVIAITGLILGLVMAIPAAGPVTVLIISNALKGRLRYSHRVAYGAAVADFVYPFIAVYAFSNLYHFYETFMPYILAFGAVLLLFIGYRFFHKNVDFEYLEDDSLVYDKERNRGGFRAGLAINFLNPALFISWLVSSFLAISLVASFGFDTGGLSNQMSSGIETINDEGINHELAEKQHAIEDVVGGFHHKSNSKSSYSHFYFLSLSFIYALMVSFGSSLWFYSLGSFVAKRRHIFKTTTINRIIHVLGLLLLGVGAYFAFKLFLTIFFG
jgi:threonine/homoserine/homoserine lactone efflux protein